MKNIASIILILVLLVIVVLDGSAMFGAYTKSQEVARGAAQQASLSFLATNGNEGVALKEANVYAESKGGELVSLDLHKVDTNWYDASVRVQAETYVFKFIPGLNRLLDQESNAVVRF